ncbi:MAG: hypothetical protein A3H42_02740 [Deltaproteobacteria bacterium RIFCSPLOWO2_02_FULL_46_8]|nr:MAG: hypothetical protein A3H42_02740 [Deltaproteobacteria bacterium RIFCSPLOWO2_02_FULL_46_8]
MSKPRPFHPLKNILGKLAKNNRWEQKLKQYEFLLHWEEIVGAKIAKQTTPTTWRGTTLCVNVSTPAWLQELRMMEPEILEKFRLKCPNQPIHKIHWSVSTRGRLPSA